MSFFVFKQNPGDLAGLEIHLTWLMAFHGKTKAMPRLSELTLFIFSSHSCCFFFRFCISNWNSLSVLTDRIKPGALGARAGCRSLAEWFHYKHAQPALWFGLLVKQHCSVFISTKCFRQMTTSLNIAAFGTRRLLIDIFVIHTNVSFLFHKC